MFSVFLLPAQAAQVSSLTSRMNSSDSSLEQQQQKSTGERPEQGGQSCSGGAVCLP